MNFGRKRKRTEKEKGIRKEKERSDKGWCDYVK